MSTRSTKATPAAKLLASANKKFHNPVTAMARLMGKEDSGREQAAQMFREAANLFIEERNWVDAAKSFEKAAHVQKGELPYDCAASLVDASNAWRSQERYIDAARTVKSAIAIFGQRGPHKRAAQLSIELANLYLLQGQRQKAVQAYENAIRWFDEQSSPIAAEKALSGLADLYVEMEEYSLAIPAYERVVKAAMTDPAARWSLKKYFFTSVLCFLAISDSIGATDALQRYTGLDRAFNATLEGQTLTKLVAVFPAQNQLEFEKVVKQHDRMHRLDKLHIELLLKVKEAMMNGSLL